MNMPVRALTMPDEPSQWGTWLEDQLLDLQLRDLVGELSTLNPAAGNVPPVEQLLGPHLKTAMDAGLAAVDPAQLVGLLRHPACLLELQERVLASGSPFWEKKLAARQEAADVLAKSKSNLQAFFRGVTQSLNPDNVAEARPARNAAGSRAAALASSARSRSQVRGVGWRQMGLVATISAATVLAGVFLVDRLVLGPRGTGQPVAWGWSKPGALDGSTSSSEYLQTLAASASEWSRQNPSSAIALAQRIGSFRQGCSVLLLSSHEPLDDTQRSWLLGKCQAWAGKLEAHLHDLEAGEDLDTVKQNANQTVNSLVKALQEEAQKSAVRPSPGPATRSKLY